jgi:nitroreductase
MDAYKCIVTKRDTRAYTDKALSEEALSRILQAGRMAGSAKNRQPCRFVVLEKEERKRELAACGEFAAYIPSAPVVVAIAMPQGAREFDAGRAAQNMMLAAWNDGIASCPVTMHDADCARRVLGLPDDHRIAIVLAFAYPDRSQPMSMGRRRIAIDELVHRDRW